MKISKIKKGVKILLFFIIVLAVVSVFAFSYIYNLFQPVSSQTAESSRFVINKGQSVSAIAKNLQAEGLIKNEFVFRFVVKKLGLQSKIQAGSFELSPDMNPSEIARKLTTGTVDLWITIPEGWRREEIASSLARQGLESLDEEEFLRLTQGLEGKLFPDTYLVPRQITAQAMVNLLTQTFEKKIVIGLTQEISSSKYDLDQALIMASLVEREALGYDQMLHVAGILWRRIEIGMPLQVDATLQYAKGYDQIQKSWWTTPLSVDKQIDSPFNTYQNPGLPPAPIANPGLNAIKASLSPLVVDDLFYIHDSSGTMHYAKTLEGHNANINKYLR